MKQERNIETLRRAIAQLSQHSAPPDSWEEVERQLDASPQPIGRDHLPTYTAPQESWTQIESQLDDMRLRRPLWQQRRWLVAACITLIAGLGLLDKDQGPIAESVAMEQKSLVSPHLRSATPADIKVAMSLQTQELMACLADTAVDKSTSLHGRMATYHQLAAKQDSLLQVWYKRTDDSTLHTILLHFDEERRTLYQQLIQAYCE